MKLGSFLSWIYLSLISCIATISVQATTVPSNRTDYSRYFNRRGSNPDPAFCQPWPKSPDGKTYIPYCFLAANSRAEGSLRQQVEYAVGKWNSKLGHVVQFYEKTYPNGQPMYCSLGRDTSGPIWNPDLGSYNVVYIMEAATTEATMGFDVTNTQPWKYYLFSMATASRVEILHEFGHILGK